MRPFDGGTLPNNETHSDLSSEYSPQTLVNQTTPDTSPSHFASPRTEIVDYVPLNGFRHPNFSL